MTLAIGKKEPEDGYDYLLEEPPLYTDPYVEEEPTLRLVPPIAFPPEPQSVIEIPPLTEEEIWASKPLRAKYPTLVNACEFLLIGIIMAWFSYLALR